jgi:hypothetical protein
LNDAARISRVRVMIEQCLPSPLLIARVSADIVVEAAEH